MEHVHRSPARHDELFVLLALLVVVGPTDVTTLFDKPPPLRVGHGLEPVVCPELAVDVMEVVAERLR